jgi:hypothetical protein
MRRHEFGFETRPLEEWLDGVAIASRKLVDDAVDRVDHLVEEVLRDASEVARNASELLDRFLASLDEREQTDASRDEEREEPSS